MHEQIEQKIQRSRPFSENPELPDSLDAMIQAGIVKGQREKLRKQKSRQRMIWLSSVACVLFLSFVLSIRFSPVFAAMVRELPGMEGFVQLVQKTMDRNLKLAVDHEFIQPVGVSDEHDGYKFTVEGIVADHSRMVVFYSIDHQVSDRFVKVGFIKLIDQNGEQLGTTVGFNYPDEKKDWEAKKARTQQGMIDVRMVDGVRIPDQVSLRLNLYNADEVPTPSPNNEYNVEIPINHGFFAGMKQEYEINQTINLEGEKLHFIKAVVHPLQIELHVQFDSQNQWELISAADMRFVDEKGNEMHHTHNSGSEQGKQVLYFESNYFQKPKHLWLKGELFRALEKDKLDFVIDTDKREILQAPDDKVKIQSINKSIETTEIILELDGIDPEDNMLYTLLESNFRDVEGNQYHKATQEGGAIVTLIDPIERGKQEVHFYIKNEAYVQPLTFKIYNYPNYIREKYRIQVK